MNYKNENMENRTECAYEAPVIEIVRFEREVMMESGNWNDNERLWGPTAEDFPE